MTGILGDRALSGEDQLGFEPTAARLAEALATAAPSDGLVVGVTGRWGSGKSSLIHLTQKALSRRSLAERPHIVEFKPWLVGDRDALLHVMFSELVAGIDQIEFESGDATGVSLRKAEKAATAVREFAGLLGSVGKLVKVGEPLLPGAAIAGSVVESFAGGLAKGQPKSLAKSKRKVCKRLGKLDRSLVVIIDDVDRLEPKEIVEILRLVRSVADFPNITYLLSYDQDIVAHAVQVAANVHDGHAYVEKIVQIVVPVPVPEAFDLRRWFERELARLELSPDWDVQRRIAEVIDREGGRYLVTPRAVVRTLDSIRFNWTALAEEVDLSDFIWLQFIKVGNPALYEWIAVYLTEISARASGRSTIPEDQIARDRQALDSVLMQEGRDFRRLSGRLSNHLPGIARNHQGADGGIYQGVHETEMNRAISARRLASPDHYRLFFAFAQPTNVPTAAAFHELSVAMMESAEQAEELLCQWQGQRLTSGVSRAEVVLDRLSIEGLIGLDPTPAQNLLVAYSNAMDRLAEGSADFFGGPDVWRRALSSLPVLLEAAGDQRNTAIRRMFTEGDAIDWLTSIFRTEIFAHGRYGDRPDHDRLLSSDELDGVTEIMLARYQGMAFEEIVASSTPLSILFAWQQGGDEAGPRNLVTAQTETDEGMVDALEHLSGVIRETTIDGARTYSTLSLSNIGAFMDYEVIRPRVEALAAAFDNPLSARAAILVQRFRDGDRF